MISPRIIIYTSVNRLPSNVNRRRIYRSKNKIELVLSKLKESGIICNIERYFFGKTEIDDLGVWVTRDGVKPFFFAIKI